MCVRGLPLTPSVDFTFVYVKMHSVEVVAILEGVGAYNLGLTCMVPYTLPSNICCIVLSWILEDLAQTCIDPKITHLLDCLVQFLSGMVQKCTILAM